MQPNPGYFWSVERTEALRRLWAEGLSASQVAKELGGVTRNAVLGKVDRLGLGGRVKPKSVRPPRIRVRKSSTGNPSAPRARKPMARFDWWSGPGQPSEPQMTDLPPEQSDCAVTFVDLRHDTCRWPMGEGADLDTLQFCGAAPFPDKPYCARHCRVAYRAPGERRRAA